MRVRGEGAGSRGWLGMGPGWGWKRAGEKVGVEGVKRERWSGGGQERTLGWKGSGENVGVEGVGETAWVEGVGEKLGVEGVGEKAGVEGSKGEGWGGGR